MADYRPLVRIAGETTPLPVTDYIDSGIGLKSTSTRALAISSGDVLTITSAAAKNITITAGAAGNILLTTTGGGIVEVTGNLKVDGTEEVVGGATFDDSATFLGDVSIGNDITDDDLNIMVKEINAEVSKMAAAVHLTCGGVDYLNINTTTAAEILSIGNASTNPDVSFLGTGDINAGNGTLNVPTNTGFKVGGTALTTTAFNAANMDKLFNGSPVTTHYHSGLSGAKLVQAGLTKSGSTATGLASYIASANTMELTDSKTAAKSVYFGVDEGTTSTMTIGGCVTHTFTTAGGSPVVNAKAWLASSDEEASAAGKLTNTLPIGAVSGAGAGNYQACVGRVLEVLSATSAVVKISSEEVYAV